MAAAKKSGVNIPEAQRNTDRLTLRLDPETMTDLRELAAECGCSVSAVIDAAMTTLYRARNDLADKKGAAVYASFIHACEGTDDPTWGAS
jgi:hypothetical protein